MAIRRCFRRVKSGVLTIAIALLILAVPSSAWAMVPFALNSSGTSHIIWAQRGASWDNRLGNYGGVTGNWQVVTGSPYHYGGDYYADDWNWRSYNEDCYKHVVVPISGTIIFKGVANPDPGYGYQVVIQSNQNSNFAWRGAHLVSGSVSPPVGTTVQAGQFLGLVGNTGTQYCHLHSVLYKNIYSYLNGQQGRVLLGQGKALFNTGGPNIFAAPFEHDGSHCNTFSASQLNLFENANCNGPRQQYVNPGLYNLTTFNDLTRSMYVPPFKSARIYQHANGGGSTRCITGSMWDLGIDTYSNGVPIVQNGLSTISSVRYYHNSTNCTL
ncbi:MAG: M23 family metallopeptidase [Candidatus Dojkabacteria bacterium]|nr:MAG: M23 family metallopeptidase [Candidatus Dojkabacteria bacterium]